MNADVRNWYHKQSIIYFYIRSEYEKSAMEILGKYQHHTLSFLLVPIQPSKIYRHCDGTLHSCTYFFIGKLASRSTR